MMLPLKYFTFTFRFLRMVLLTYSFLLITLRSITHYTLHINSMSQYSFNIKQIFTLRGYATILLVVMLTQFVAWEGYGVSDVKVALMALSPVMLIVAVPYFTRAVLWGSVYMAAVLLAAYSQEYVRFSTIGYLGMFLLTFMVFYNLVYVKEVFSLLYFIRFLRTMISSFAICLILQQLFVLIGVHNLPIINLANQPFLAIDKLPTLNIEPSHAARVLGFLYLAYLECCQIVEEQPLSLKRIFEPRHRWITIGFLYTMTTMGSGTAFIVLMVLSLYFIRAKYLWYVIPIFLAIYFILPTLGIKQFDRATATINATLTGNTEEVKNADGSAASRVVPILNTLLYLDLSKKETWFGYGTRQESGVKRTKNEALIATIGNIGQYGLISFVVLQIMVFSCIIKQSLSLSTLLYGCVLGFSLINFAYAWGCAILMLTLSYFKTQKNYRANNHPT